MSGALQTASTPNTGSAPGAPRWVLVALALTLAALFAVLYFTPKPKPKPVFYASTSLKPGAVHTIQWLGLPPEATGAQIELRNVPKDAAQAQLRRVSSGDIVWRGPLSLSVAIVPATVLGEGDYVLTVADNPAAPGYSFRVRRSVP